MHAARAFATEIEAPGHERVPGTARVAALLAAALAGCGGASPVPAPSWVALSDALRLDAAGERKVTLHPWNGRSVELVVEDGGAKLRVPLRREDWSSVPEHDAWRMNVNLNLQRHAGLRDLELTTPAGPIPRAALDRIAKGDGLQGFTYLRGVLAVGGVVDAAPEASTLTCVFLDPGPRPDGRIEQGGFAGRGVSVLPGSSASCTIAVPRESTLRFGTSAERILGPLSGHDESVFRVRLDGEVLFEHRQRLTQRAVCAWHAVPLPAAGRASARLVFEVEGSLANTLFCDPRLGPREVGRRADRPWREERPDIVVFLADTFRADNLAAYGGPAGVTPNLDALAERSLCFLRAWSTAPWTLPSHASLFSGYHPHQVHAAGQDCKLPEEVETVMERLSRADYRTGAVTDGGFVSSRFGMHQGFDYFSERTGELSELLDEARAFLDADDGRPTFLFVHTYRTHWPYRVGERTRAELGERLGIRGQAADLLSELEAEAGLEGRGRRVFADLLDLPRTPRLLELERELHAHYLGAVADLDRELAGFLAHLGASAMLASGYLVFTSDHGEAFGEHAALFHGGDPFEEQVRVPLLIAGRGIAGARIEHPVSLVDLAPTLAELCGFDGAPDWPGRSLLAARSDRAVFGFESAGKPEDSLFVLEQEKKVLCLPGGRVLGAYDLATDAREESDRAALEDWPRALLAKHDATLQVLLAPLVEAQAAEIDADKAAELEALGY